MCCCVYTQHSTHYTYMRIISLGGDDLHTHRSAAGGRMQRKRRSSHRTPKTTPGTRTVRWKSTKGHTHYYCVWQKRLSLSLIYAYAHMYNTNAFTKLFLPHEMPTLTDVTVQRARKKTPTRSGVMLFTHSPCAALLLWSNIPG
jgi:hypothetical protein